VLHELGHALGLKHPFGASPFVSTTLPDEWDSQSYTVMSYSPSINSSSSAASYYPTTPMVLDVQAIQFIYGANNNYNSGDSTYAYSDALDYRETVWDGGGNDRIRYTGSISSTIDLRQGQGSPWQTWCPKRQYTTVASGRSLSRRRQENTQQELMVIYTLSLALYSCPVLPKAQALGQAKYVFRNTSLNLCTIRAKTGHGHIGMRTMTQHELRSRSITTSL